MGHAFPDATHPPRASKRKILGIVRTLLDYCGMSGGQPKLFDPELAEGDRISPDSHVLINDTNRSAITVFGLGRGVGYVVVRIRIPKSGKLTAEVQFGHNKIKLAPYKTQIEYEQAFRDFAALVAGRAGNPYSGSTPRR